MAHPKNKNINRMSKLFMIIFLLFFFVIMVRFAFIGITKNVHGHDLMAMAHNRWTTTHHLQSQRGKILDTHGNVLAKDVPSYTLIAVVSEEAKYHVKNKRLTARKLSPILHMKKQKIIHILSKDAYQVEFGLKGHRLSYAKKQKLPSLICRAYVFYLPNINAIILIKLLLLMCSVIPKELKKSVNAEE